MTLTDPTFWINDEPLLIILFQRGLKLGRLVRPTRTVTVADLGRASTEAVESGQPPKGQATVQEQGDTYLERVAKYVPAEIVAFFIFANSILKQSLHETPATMAGVSVVSIGVVVFLLTWAFVPIYIYQISKPGDALRLNAFLATLLFPIWAYAVEGVGLSKFVEYDGHLASIVLGGASLVSGLFAPSAETDKPAG